MNFLNRAFRPFRTRYSFEDAGLHYALTGLLFTSVIVAGIYTFLDFKIPLQVSESYQVSAPVRKLQPIKPAVKKTAFTFKMQEAQLNIFPESMRAKVRSIYPVVKVLSKKYQVDPLWSMAIMWTESHFNVHALSNKGAKGLMQLMPKTQAYLIRKIRAQNYQLHIDNPTLSFSSYFDISNLEDGIALSNYKEVILNIELGVYYLKQLEQRFNSQKLATIAYNMGPTWTARQLKQKRKLGVKNKYLDKVQAAKSKLKLMPGQTQRVATNN